MTVPTEFIQAYNQIQPILQKLEARCTPLLKGVARSVGGKFLYRIKPVESVLLKIERDSPQNPFHEFDDLFAAMIIVSNKTLISQAEKEVEKLFEIIEKVPKKTKRPEMFIYDDLHLILKLRQEVDRADLDVLDIKFELQIKTEMQSAVSTIARELSYKTRWLSWDKTRLESSIRALTEMVDDLLASLAETQEGDQEPLEEPYELFAKRNKIIRVLERTLAPEQILSDRRRLAVTIENYLSTCNKLSIEALQEILEKEDYKRFREAISLSAAQSVFIILFLDGKLLSRPSDPSSLRGDRCYLITREMIDLCPLLNQIPESRRVQLSFETQSSNYDS